MRQSHLCFLGGTERVHFSRQSPGRRRGQVLGILSSGECAMAHADCERTPGIVCRCEGPEEGRCCPGYFSVQRICVSTLH